MIDGKNIYGEINVRFKTTEGLTIIIKTNDGTYPDLITVKKEINDYFSRVISQNG